ncbi:MAG: GNAT family N-acetyltransferase [Saprospiraceae bacterium]|nr:GNAT family N-acetyltransferase [Saprospiraceae bacterium]
MMQETLPINKHISLTPFNDADKGNLVKYLNDEAMRRNTLRVPHPYTPKDADEWLEKVKQNLADRGRTVNWVIRHREAGAIGGIGSFLKNGLDGHSDEIGYWIAGPFRGQGIMTEVVRQFCAHLFDTRPALLRIEAWVFAHNQASVRVLEKAGFEREGFSRKAFFKNGTPLDAILLGLVRDSPSA